MVEPIITLESSFDTITMTGTNLGGFIYDNATLNAWLKLSEVNVKLNKRPNAHGTYSPDQLFTGEARVPISGQFYGFAPLDAVHARNQMSAMFNDGRPITMTVTDDLGATSRTGFLVSYEPDWNPDGHFAFTAELAAADPRRYGPVVPVSTGLATASSGLVWPLGIDDADDLFWDWGTAGTGGRVEFTNDGNTTTYPIMLAGTDGDMAEGFELTEVQTGRSIIYPVGTAGGVVRIDNRTQRVTINGGDVTGNLTRREWFAIPPGGTTYEYQFVTLGATTGAPTLQLLVANAYL